MSLELQTALEELAVPVDVYDSKAIRAALFALRAVLMSAPEREVGLNSHSITERERGEGIVGFRWDRL